MKRTVSSAKRKTPFLKESLESPAPMVNEGKLFRNGSELNFEGVADTRGRSRWGGRATADRARDRRGVQQQLVQQQVDVASWAGVSLWALLQPRNSLALAVTGECDDWGFI